MNRHALEETLAKARTEDERLAWFGALLTRESRLEGRLIIVGGSAIELLLTSTAYVSLDIDIVGSKVAISAALRRWGFKMERGRDHRTYWVKEGLGLVDLVGARNRSGLPARAFPTRYGDVLVSPVEDLIVRRLVMARQMRSTDLFRQAEILAARYRRGLDWDYIRAETSYEKILPLFEQLRQQVERNPRS